MYKKADAVAGEMGCFYYRKGSTVLAKQTLLKVLPTQYKSDNVLLCLGRIYNKEGLADSARYYWGETLKYGNISGVTLIFAWRNWKRRREMRCCHCLMTSNIKF